MTTSRHAPGAAVLGLSFDYHDSAAAIIVDGRVHSAADEERFTRLKHDASLPAHAMRWCCEHAEVQPSDLAAVAFYDKPFSTYERILHTSAAVGPRGFRTTRTAIASWSRRKLWVRYRIAKELAAMGARHVPIRFAEHHHSHAASAFYPSPFESAAILTFDGVGEWTTSSLAWGSGHRIEMLRETHFPDSLGLFYSAMTAFCGFKVNDGEYKLMGLAPYGTDEYSAELLGEVIKVHPDGSVELNQRWFDYRAGTRMFHPRLSALLGGPPRTADEPTEQRHANIARSTQVVLETAVLAAADYAAELTGERHAVLSGGVALNCVANAKLRADGPFDDIWIQPASGDNGSALGAALWHWHQTLNTPRTVSPRDAMAGAALGPSYRNEEIADWLDDLGATYTQFDDRAALNDHVVSRLTEGQAIGWFQGRMEFGPRALGHRSIIADPRHPEMVQRVNMSVKKRESFRPFAPAVIAEKASDWFDLDDAAPYMLETAAVAAHQRVASDVADDAGFGERLGATRSTIPACTHVDGSARVQTVTSEYHPEFRALLERFDEVTGCPVLLNTSFNRNNEPIVRTPADALRCFVDTDLDALVLEHCVMTLDDARAIFTKADA